MQELLDEILHYVIALDYRAVWLVLELRGPLVTKVMTSVTGLGSAAAAAVFLGVFYLAGWRDEYLTAGVAILVVGALVPTLMGLFQRPFPPQPVCMTGGAETVAHSFPSGHAAAVTVFALTAWRSDQLPTLPVAGLAALVAVSRVYLGTHFLSDTVAGVVLGAGATLLAWRLVSRFALGEKLPSVLVPVERTSR
jgi:undecaprenyl-diphosphatase